MDSDTDRAGWLVKTGLGLVGLAVIGWLVTLLAVSFTARPHSVEDLTAVWRKAGPTALDATASVTVPPGDTLVAFLVGTDLTGIAGTTGGSCSATSQGHPLGLTWPVQIETVLSGILEPGQQTVPIAGWSNDGSRDALVEISCSTRDSTVSHFVAVPTRTGAVEHDPWFQPWLWIGTGGCGLLVLSAAVFVGTR
jgi:hypothetical protein